jgi:alkylation response protein AidB-like acyl-CoA dehydrogenase
MAAYELSQDHRALRDAARKFAQDVLHPASMETEKAGRDFPSDLLRQMGELGLLGLDIPAEYGGQGFDTLTCGVILEEISAKWFSAASYGMTLSTGPILFAGSEAQKQHVLPRLCRGEIVTAFALTEPDGGSDAAAIKTFARRDGDDYVINGTKMYITNAHRADVIVLFARTDANAARGHGISIFLVDKGTRGLIPGERYRTLGHQANGISEIVFDDCRIPRANLVGEEGKGFAYIQRGFATKVRAVYGARCVGVAQGAIDYALQYANERRQFGQTVASFQGNRFKVADMLSKIEAARHLSYRACVLADQETEEAAVAASMAKHFASNVCMEATSEAIQLMGGHGYVGDHPLERYYREAKLFQIGDGTSEVLRLLISRYANARAQARQPARLT